ncbi:MAG: hypothetical protein MJA82_18930 [Clostridia bacterium]|nr:hypothetical protein [Clostridia bacterium]
MHDFLKEFCRKSNIRLIYTNNKYKVCSVTVYNNVPKLRVHKIFKNCPEHVANALISYFIKFENLDNARNTIEEYLFNNYPVEEFYIESPNEDMKFVFINSIKPSLPSNKDDTEPKELDILSISKSDMRGNISKVNPQDTMLVEEGDLLEVNITVDMPN